MCMSACLRTSTASACPACDLSCCLCSVYARAFREGFTVTLVSGRTVGIGAYLARLGRRSVLVMLAH